MGRKIQCDVWVREKLDYLAGRFRPSEFSGMVPEPIELVKPPFSNVSCEQYAIGTWVKASYCCPISKIH